MSQFDSLKAAVELKLEAQQKCEELKLNLLEALDLLSEVECLPSKEWHDREFALRDKRQLCH